MLVNKDPANTMKVNVDVKGKSGSWSTTRIDYDRASAEAGPKVGYPTLFNGRISLNLPAYSVTDLFVR